jgi:hypothetical protein
MMSHFLNDNTSPEITSFHPVRSRESRGIGRQIARETLIRFMLTQLLVQQRLNACISDAFYRHLFMSPCLSGWARGQEKYDYMHLCHQVLSRSQLNGIAKLKEAGIINSNLVVLMNHTLGAWLGYPISPMGVMAAAAIAYAFGEGLGRLACISFGCCYGRPLHQCHPMVQPFLSRFCLTFTGHTKKNRLCLRTGWPEGAARADHDRGPLLLQRPDR